MDYHEWFAAKVDPSVLGELSIKEFGAIVHRATLRGDIAPPPGEQATPRNTNIKVADEIERWIPMVHDETFRFCEDVTVAMRRWVQELRDANKLESV